jgi:hypothetical protein
MNIIRDRREVLAASAAVTVNAGRNPTRFGTLSDGAKPIAGSADD